jgi:hypothetical protein
VGESRSADLVGVIMMPFPPTPIHGDHRPVEALPLRDEGVYPRMPRQREATRQQAKRLLRVAA